MFPGTRGQPWGQSASAFRRCPWAFPRLAFDRAFQRLAFDRAFDRAFGRTFQRLAFDRAFRRAFAPVTTVRIRGGNESLKASCHA